MWLTGRGSGQWSKGLRAHARKHQLENSLLGSQPKCVGGLIMSYGGLSRCGFSQFGHLVLSGRHRRLSGLAYDGQRGSLRQGAECNAA